MGNRIECIPMITVKGFVKMPFDKSGYLLNLTADNKKLVVGDNLFCEDKGEWQIKGFGFSKNTNHLLLEVEPVGSAKPLQNGDKLSVSKFQLAAKNS